MLGGLALASSFLPACLQETEPGPADTATGAPVVPPSGAAYLSVARGESPTAIVQAALKALGGIERFVKSGNAVIIKPNICTASYTYEYAATTNPEVVAALVQLCLGAGARSVRVMDNAFSGRATWAYSRCGIKEAAEAAGGSMEEMTSMKYREADIAGGRANQRPDCQTSPACPLNTGDEEPDGGYLGA